MKKNNKKITFVNEYYPPDYAPTGQLINDLAERLGELKYKVQILTSFPYYANTESKTFHKEKKKNLLIWRTKFTRIFKNYKILNLLKSFLFSLRIFFKLIFSSRDTDLIFFTTVPPFMMVFGYLTSLITKSPYIVILFDLIPENLIDLKFIRKNHPFTKLILFLRNLAIKKSKYTIVLSTNMYDRLKKQLPSIGNKLKIISTWEDSKKLYKIPQEKNKYIKNFNLGDKFVILYSGNQGRGHDMKTILKSAKKLASYKNIVFMFVGNGFHNKKIRNYIKYWDLSNCMILPYQPQKDLIHLLSAADLGLVSVSEEATDIVAPSKLNGHLACENAVGVISSKKSYLKNIVEKNELGMWFENNDYINLSKWILELKSDNKILGEYKKNSKAFFLENANRLVTLDKYISLIEN